MREPAAGRQGMRILRLGAAPIRILPVVLELQYPTRLKST
jgi:hypothetical protein